MTQGERNKTRRLLTSSCLLQHRSAVLWGRHWQCSAAAQLAEGKQGAAQDPAGSDVKYTQKPAPSDGASPAADQRENPCAEKTSAATLFPIRGRRLPCLLRLQLHKNSVSQTLVDFLQHYHTGIPTTTFN